MLPLKESHQLYKSIPKKEKPRFLRYLDMEGGKSTEVLKNLTILLEKFDSENKFRSIAATASDAIIYANNNGLIESWNEAAQIIFGYTEDEVKGRPIEIIVPDNYKERHRQGINR